MAPDGSGRCRKIEFAREDECVEVTPEFVRIRKVELDANSRARATSRLKKQNA